jgi:hypothetical protein
MIRRLPNLDERERNVYQAVCSFLEGRLGEQVTIDWALGLKPNDEIERFALLYLLDSTAGRVIGEPWRSAWRLIEESWNKPPVDEHNPKEHSIKERLRGGDRSGTIIARIVELVEARLQVWPPHPKRNPRKKPKRVEDLVSTGLTSGKSFDPALLDSVADAHFLRSLASALDFAVTNGLDIARRIGWDGQSGSRQLGPLYRVYFVPPPYLQEKGEPDEFHRGIAPSTKLLNAVVSRLVEVDVSSAQEFISRWKITSSPVHTRLWASFSRDSRVTPAVEVGDFLISLPDRVFWDVSGYPEIVELRARRFSEFSPKVQATISTRIRRSPPKKWPKMFSAEEIIRARAYWAVRELRRIEVAGARLPMNDRKWLESIIPEFKELAVMKRLDFGFPGAAETRLRQPTPDHKFYSLEGVERLRALEADLSSKGARSLDVLFGPASDWIKQGNLDLLLADLESAPGGGNSYPEVWNSFCWAHFPPGGDAANRDPPAECARVLAFLVMLSDATIRKAIDGISHWFSVWRKAIVAIHGGVDFWLRVWPVAVEVTNARETVKKLEEFEDGFGPEAHDQAVEEIDSHDSPAGRLAGVFVAACPNLNEDRRPFDIDKAPRKMRDAIMAATGPARLVALYRMIEELNYFLLADKEWVNENLVRILLDENPEFLRLWPGVARQTHFTEVLKLIGERMAERATDLRLERKTRHSFVFSLVVECLYALLESRDPAVPYPRVQQMIRLLDDEVRAYAAQAILSFVRQLSGAGNGERRYPPEQLFKAAARPFLERHWPREHSLRTPGVSRALAELPAATEGAFAEAVGVIEDFLVPFECWSMQEYGLWGEEQEPPKLQTINDRGKAVALLRLLNLTVGTAEGSVIPYDLAEALDQIRKASPTLMGSRAFRRLATAARKG